MIVHKKDISGLKFSFVFRLILIQNQRDAKCHIRSSEARASVNIPLLSVKKIFLECSTGKGTSWVFNWQRYFLSVQLVERLHEFYKSWSNGGTFSEAHSGSAEETLI